MSQTSNHLIDSRFIKNCHSCVAIEKDADRIIFNMSGFCRGVLRRDHHGSKGWIGRTVIFAENHYTDSREVPPNVDDAKNRLLKEIIQKELVLMMFDERVDARFKPTPEEILDALPSENIKRLYLNEKIKVISKNKGKVLTLSIISCVSMLVLGLLIVRRNRL